MSPEVPSLQMRRIIKNLIISFVTGNSMATGLTNFMDGYKNFMETKSGEFLWENTHSRCRSVVSCEFLKLSCCPLAIATVSV
jgi:hypothetical protein